jgi:hypothetical protein
MEGERNKVRSVTLRASRAWATSRFKGAHSPSPLNIRIVQWRIVPQPMHATGFHYLVDDLR